MGQASLELMRPLSMLLSTALLAMETKFSNADLDGDFGDFSEANVLGDWKLDLRKFKILGNGFEVSITRRGGSGLAIKSLHFLGL